MTAPVVRAAVAGELPEIGRICVDAYAADGFVDRDEPYARRLGEARARFTDAELLVAADADGTLLGTVTVCPPGTPYAEVSGPGELEFRMLAVDPPARGRGVGALLTRAVIDRAMARGDHSVVLSSLAAMRGAHRVYERLGFVRAPERDWSPVPDTALIVYVLPLDSTP